VNQEFYTAFNSSDMGINSAVYIQELMLQIYDSMHVEDGLWKSATTLPSCRGYLEVDYWGNLQESKLYCWGESSTFIYAQGI